MAQKKVEAGKTYRLTDDLGVGPGAIPAGADLTVTGVFPPGTPGIGYCEEDTVLANYVKPSGLPQTVAIPVSTFAKMVKAVA